MIDFASTATLVITVALFIVAVFEKGMTHEILLEAGVFLVSVKLVLAVVKIERMIRDLETKIDRNAANQRAEEAR